MYTTITSNNISLFRKARKSLTTKTNNKMKTTTKTKKVYPRAHTNKHDLFTYVEQAEKNVIICVGQHRVSEKQFSSVAAAKKYTEEKPWELICNVSSLVAQHTFNELKKKENETNS